MRRLPFPRRACRRLAADRQGLAAVEFALLSPVLMIALMGLFDLAYTMYTSALLEGAIQKAARDSTIEGAGAYSTALDDRVSQIVDDIAPQATMAFSRKWYTNFTDVRQPEDFTDVNHNGTCDTGEPYEDINANDSWDADRGTAGDAASRATCSRRASRDMA